MNELLKEDHLKEKKDPSIADLLSERTVLSNEGSLSAKIVHMKGNNRKEKEGLLIEEYPKEKKDHSKCKLQALVEAKLR